MKPELHKWYYEEDVFVSNKNHRRTLYYFTVDKPEEYILSGYCISKMSYPDGTSFTCIEDNRNAYGVWLGDLIPCDNPEEIYKELIGDYDKFFKK